ncbi:MAG: sigma factor-like helix-turn-helix DNA-binding protein [Ruminococcus callidus]
MPIDDVVISDDTDVSAQAEQAGIVQEMLAQLSEQDRELLLRFYFYRQSVREIAGEMHMKESTVKTRMYRSRKNCGSCSQKGVMAMSKWNLFEIFSHLHVTGEDLPKIRRTARISRRAVRSRVLASLDEEAAAGVPARSHAPHWKMGTDSGGADRGGSAGQRQCDHRGSGNRRLFPADAAGVWKRRFVSVHAGRSVHRPQSGSDGHL